MPTQPLCGYETLDGSTCRNPVNHWSKTCAAGHPVQGAVATPSVASTGSDAALSGTIDFEEHLGLDVIPPCPVDEYETVGLTPRNWASLYVSLGYVAEGIREDTAFFGPRPISENYGDEEMMSQLDRLPRVTHAMDETWRLRLAQSADDLRWDMDRGQWPLPRSVGEEAVLHLAFEEAQMLADMELLDEQLADMPSDAADGEWDDVVEALFQDDDYRTVFGSALADGLEDPSSEVNQELGMGSYQPKSWFVTFDNMDGREF